jgi:GNAT superfamily N-acetyltransferase
MREASISDKEYIAECFVNISRHIKSQASDIYIDGLPDCVDTQTLELATSYITDEKAIACIVEKEARPVACLAGRIEETSFPPSGVGTIGNIAICWVAEEFREQNIGSDLVSYAESWFLSRGVKVIELSYLAQNSLAEKAWSRIGYVPFRIYSHKVLENA